MVLQSGGSPVLRSVQQGTMALDVLAKELSDVPLPELEALLSAAAKGELWMRNKSVAALGYLRGISCDSICSFLRICPRSALYRKTPAHGYAHGSLEARVRHRCCPG